MINIAVELEEWKLKYQGIIVEEMLDKEFSFRVEFQNAIISRDNIKKIVDGKFKAWVE